MRCASARRRCQRQWPAAGDSLAGRCSRGRAPPPWPDRMSRRWWSPGRWSTARRRVPAPADQARANNSRLTRSSWRTWPHRKLRRNVPRVDGALTTQPMVPAVPLGCSTSASSACRRRWLVLGHRPGRGGAERVGTSRDAKPMWLAGSAERWATGGGHRRRFACGRGGCVVASIGRSSVLVGRAVQQPLSPKHRSTFLPPQHAATLIFSVDWGLVNSQYQPITIEQLPEGSLQGHSEILNLDLRWENGQLGWYDPNTGQHIPTLDDAEDRADTAEARVRELEETIRRLRGE